MSETTTHVIADHWCEDGPITCRQMCDRPILQTVGYAYTLRIPVLENLSGVVTLCFAEVQLRDNQAQEMADQIRNAIIERYEGGKP